MNNLYEYRQARPGEAAAAAAIEAACFPPSEACTLPIMERRAELAPDCFVVAEERSTGRIVGFTIAIAVNEEHLRDEFFTAPNLHDPEGAYLMILSVAVHPDYRHQGIARNLMAELLRIQTGKRKAAVLTCIPANIELYEKMGYRDCGTSSSDWGGELWHEMIHDLSVNV